MSEKITNYVKEDIAIVNVDGNEVKIFPSTIDEQVLVPDGMYGETTLDVELEHLRAKINELEEGNEEGEGACPIELLEFEEKTNRPLPISTSKNNFEHHLVTNVHHSRGLISTCLITNEYGDVFYFAGSHILDTTFPSTGLYCPDTRTCKNYYGFYRELGKYPVGDYLGNGRAILFGREGTASATPLYACIVDLTGSSKYDDHLIEKILVAPPSDGQSRSVNSLSQAVYDPVENMVYLIGSYGAGGYFARYNLTNREMEYPDSTIDGQNHNLGWLTDGYLAPNGDLYILGTIYTNGSGGGSGLSECRTNIYKSTRTNRTAWTRIPLTDSKDNGDSGEEPKAYDALTNTLYVLPCNTATNQIKQINLNTGEVSLGDVPYSGALEDARAIQTVYGIIVIGGRSSNVYPQSNTPKREIIEIVNRNVELVEIQPIPRNLVNPYVPCTQENRPIVSHIGFQIYDTILKEPLWWNGEVWESVKAPSKGFETDWGLVQSQESQEKTVIEDLSNPTFETGDWILTTKNGINVIKSKTITHNQSTSLVVTLTNVTSITVGMMASSESNFDKFYLYFDGSSQFYISGDGVTRSATFDNLNSAATYQLEFKYTKDSSVDKYDNCGYITKLEYTQTKSSDEEDGPIEVQMTRGQQTALNLYTGQDGQLVYNQTTKRLHTMDGVTKGGRALALLSDVPTIPSTYDATKITLNSSHFNSNNVKGALEELFQSVDNGKTLVASAITDKGVETSKNDTFSQMAENISLISTCDHNGQLGDSMEKIVITTLSIREFEFHIYVVEGETCRVDWGDGVVDEVGSDESLISHTYSDSQQREIIITGSKTKKTIYRVYFYKDGTTISQNNSKIKTFHSEYVCFTNCENMFRSAKYLTNVTMRGGYYRPTSAASMFYGNHALIEAPDVIDLSDCTSATSMFESSYKLEKCPDLIDCSKIVTASRMFNRTRAMKNIKTLNLQSCTSATELFWESGISVLPKDFNVPRLSNKKTTQYTYRDMGREEDGYTVTFPHPIIMSVGAAEYSLGNTATQKITKTNLTGKLIIYISHDVVEEGIETEDKSLQFEINVAYMENLTDLRIHNLREYGNFAQEDGTYTSLTDVTKGPYISVNHTGLDEKALERLVSDLPTLHHVYGTLHTHGAVGFNRNGNYIKEAQKKGWVTPFKTYGGDDYNEEESNVSVYFYFNASSSGPDPNYWIEMALFSESNEYFTMRGSTTSDGQWYGRSGQFLHRNINRSTQNTWGHVDGRSAYKIQFKLSNYAYIQIFRSPDCVFKDCDQMFTGQNFLKTIENGKTWIPRTAIEMFMGCTLLQSLPLDLLDLSQCVNTSSMLKGCKTLTTMQNRFDLASCENAEGMFSGADKLVFSKDGEGMIISNLKTPIEIKDKPGIEKIVFENMANFSCTNEERANGKIEIDLSNCGLDAGVLNDILRSLNTECVGNTIDISGNLGASTCDTSLVNSSSWRVITTK